VTARPPRVAGSALSPTHTNGAGLALELPEGFVEAVAARVADLLGDREPAEPEPWIDLKVAAQYLACKPARIYALVSARRIPHEKDGTRLLFRRSELDAWIAQGGGIRP
jgi:excisionase family DNA binding protein